MSALTFAIRKPATAVFKLADYVSAGVMIDAQTEILQSAASARPNILVAGGSSTVKTIVKRGEQICRPVLLACGLPDLACQNLAKPVTAYKCLATTARTSPFRT
jgi:hypothetical protein